MVEDQNDGSVSIDCEATKKANGCPWQDELGETPGAVYGMFGTSCWYRGKVGMWMLETLKSADYEPPIDFYGSDEDGLTASECLNLSKWMADHAGAYAFEISKEDEYGDNPKAMKEELEGYAYAVKWLKWAGENCNGIEAWW
jgi:hypothetical protein